MSEDYEKQELEKVEDGSESTSTDDNQYEKVCFLWRRPESKVGKMIDLPNDIHICTECMKQSFNAMKNSNMNYGELMNNMHNISMIDLSNITGQITRSQKDKKKK